MFLSDLDLRDYIKSRRLVIDSIFEDTVRENGLDLRLGEEMAWLRPNTVTMDTNHAPDLRQY